LDPRPGVKCAERESLGTGAKARGLKLSGTETASVPRQRPKGKGSRATRNGGRPRESLGTEAIIRGLERIKSGWRKESLGTAAQGSSA
jgi:hypothetical protein